MKDDWWFNKARELQDAADRHDLKVFYDGLKAVYGPRDTGPSLQIVRASCLDRRNTFMVSSTREQDPTVLSDIPDWDTNHDLMQTPSATEVLGAVNQMASGKAPGPDGLPSELFKAGGREIINKLVTLYGNNWSKRSVPQDLKDALIVHIFKRKGDRSICDDHRGISLLSVPGKILAVSYTHLTLPTIYSV